VRTVRAALHETARLMLSRRWVGAALLCALGAYLAAGDVARVTHGTTLTPSAWDVHAAALNSLMYLGYLVFTAYVFVVGDTLVDDRKTGYAWVVSPRLGARLRWWAGKLTSLVLVAFAVQVVFLALCLSMGALRGGWTLAPAASAFASAAASTPQARSHVDTGTLTLLFAPLDAGVDMARRQLLLCLYETLAFSALGACLVALTVRWSKAFIPITVAVVGLVADYIAVKSVDGWRALSPGRRLLEGIHASFAGWRGEPLWASLLYWSALLALAAILGGWALRRADL